MPDRTSQEQITLWLAGDVMTGRGIDQILPHPCTPQLLENWVRDARQYVWLAEQVNGPVPAPVDPAYIWGEALTKPTLASADLRLINLETAITRHGRPWPDKRVHYRMSPEHVYILQAAHIDICSLANNHVLDWGRDRLLDTLQVLHKAGLRTAGAGTDQTQAEKPAVWQASARPRWLVFAWACMDSGTPPAWQAQAGQPGLQTLQVLNESSAQQVAQTVCRYRQAGDRVILSMHWGSNWGWQIPHEHVTFAHRLIDWGVVDLLHGHSSHHPRPIEVYKNKLILYGCGDLINDYEGLGHSTCAPSIAIAYLARLSSRTGDLLQLQLQPWTLHWSDALA